MKLELDKYSSKARLYPSFIVLLPPFIVSVFYVTDFEKYYHYFTAVFGVGLFTFLLAQIGRDKGKSKEPKLHEFFGGKPTIQILRHRNNHLDKVTKARYHKLLKEKISDIEVPTQEQEFQNPHDADQVYDSCGKYLISKTRDTQKFCLLFKENISYGFRRNLWGMKGWALLLLVCCFAFHFYFATKHLSVFNQFENKDLGLFAILLVITMFWLIVVNKNWVRIPAFAYAERLFESLNDLT